MANARVLLRLVRDPASAERVGAQQGPVKQATAVSQVLARKVESERKYLARLEGKPNPPQPPLTSSFPILPGFYTMATPIGNYCLDSPRKASHLMSSLLSLLKKGRQLPYRIAIMLTMVSG